MSIFLVKLIDISDKELIILSNLVNIEEKIRKLINKKDKIRALMAEILLRIIIGEEFGISNKKIVFEYNEFGKPYLKEHPIFNFNISHSGDFVVCVTDNKPIGIDIEKVENINYEKIARSFFTLGEFEYIFSDEQSDMLGKFYDIWVLKENFIKFCGQGLSMSLKSFTMEIDECENIKVQTEGKCIERAFQKFDLISGYKMAICSVNKDMHGKIICKDQSSLIHRFYDYISDNYG